MGCYSCGGNPNTWCTKCMPAEDTWVAPVDKLPDVFMGDRDHMYLLPNGDLFILSPDRTKWIKVNGTGNTTAYDDTEIKKRITDLENRPDKDTITTVTQGKRIRVTKNGNDYTVSGTPLRAINIAEGGKEPLVSLGINNDGDTFTLNTLKLAEELGKLQKKEDRPVTPLGVTTFFAKGDISGNGNSQGVKVTKDKLVNADTIKVGDIVTDSYWNKDLFNIGMFKVASVDGNTVTLNGINDITYRHPKQGLTLSGRVLSISDGNSVTLPNDKQTISRQGNKLVLSNGGGEVDLPTPKDAVPYDDTALKKRVDALEKKEDNDRQTLSLSGTTLSISNGNSVNLPQYVSPQEFNNLKNEYNKLKGAFTALLQNLKNSGAWNQTGGTIFEGSLRPDRNIATGNINLFGGTVDGNAFIRTNNGKTENDLAGGIS